MVMVLILLMCAMSTNSAEMYWLNHLAAPDGKCHHRRRLCLHGLLFLSAFVRWGRLSFPSYSSKRPMLQLRPALVLVNMAMIMCVLRWSKTNIVFGRLRAILNAFCP